ncbi:MAG TPA: hypothetical protein VFU95_02670 [Telluria sp.]|nr:hypothetical protein [Telluria sp.]
MYLTLKKSLIAAALAVVAAGLCSAPAIAAEKKAVAKKAPAKKKAKEKAEPKVEEDTGPSEADDGDTITTDYRCELGNTLTIFQHADDDSHIALRWKKRVHRLDKIGTTTGAQRYQNTTFGLIWIGIPSKGMLLDAKLNRQLANECKNADQEKGEFAIKTVVKPAQMPSTKVIEKVEPIVPVDKQPLPLTPAAVPAAATPATPTTAPVVTPATPTTAPAAAPASIVTPVPAPADAVPVQPTPTLPSTATPAVPPTPPATEQKPVTN